jgi:GxxExxY protein
MTVILAARRELWDPQIAQMTQIQKTTLPQRDPETYAIIGAAMMVHRTLGKGFLEAVYREALGAELELRRIPFRREVEIAVYYRGLRLETRYRADLVCFDGVLVELKALTRLTEVDDSQIINYLKASQLGRGLLLNFGSTSLQYRRFVGSASSEFVSAQSVKSVDSTSPTP